MFLFISLDLCVGLLSVLTDIIWRITVSWRAGNVACKCIRFVQACVTYASTYVLVALSIDRYDAITNPMNFSGSCESTILRTINFNLTSVQCCRATSSSACSWSMVIKCSVFITNGHTLRGTSYSRYKYYC